MDCVKPIAEPKWIFGEQVRPGEMRFTFMFFPDQHVDKLLPAIREAVTRLPGEIRVVSVEKLDPKPDHQGFGNWRADGVSYYIWAWEADMLMLTKQLQVASMALKFNGDALIRLRDVATLHAGARRVADK